MWATSARASWERPWRCRSSRIRDPSRLSAGCLAGWRAFGGTPGMLACYIFSEHARSDTTLAARRGEARLYPVVNEAHMTRRDWWIGVVLIVVALLLHAALPRYEWRQLGTGGTWSRTD